MPNYRRYRALGGCFFFTVCVAEGIALRLTDHIEPLREAYLSAQIAGPFQCDAMVVLPDHMHMVWRMPVGDTNYARRIAHLKSQFSRRMRRAGFIPPAPIGADNGGVNPALRRKGELGLWQSRFWEHRIRDAADWETHVTYCWQDPVRHSLSARASDWPYSSIHQDLKHGHVDANWAPKRLLPSGEFGERASSLSSLHAAALPRAASG